LGAPRKAERDACIARAWQAGASNADIAAEFGLTPRSAYDLVARLRARIQRTGKIYLPELDDEPDEDDDDGGDWCYTIRAQSASYCAALTAKGTRFDRRR
jgi:hypothetical protein